MNRPFYYSPQLWNSRSVLEYLLGSGAFDAVEESLQAIEGGPDHVVVPVAVDIDTDDGL